MKIAELKDLALDWAVELAKGTFWSGNGYFVFKNADGSTRTFERNPEWRYSTDWSKGGPIIEREIYKLERFSSTVKGRSITQNFRATTPGFEQFGPTPLIAAMRCYVASKLGDEIDIPEGIA